MKVVYLNPSGQLGGAEVSLLDILASLRAAEPTWPLHLIAADDGPLVSRARQLGVETIVLPFPPSIARLGDAGVGGPAGNQTGRLALSYKLLRSSASVAVYTRQLRRALRRLQPELVHTNGFKMHVLGVWSSPAPAPVVWHVHDYVSLRPVMTRLLRRYSRDCAAVVANSRSVAEDVQSICGAGLKVYSVYNGVDLERFSPTGEALDLDALSGLGQAASGVVRVGLLGTLGRWKGHAIFLKALSLLPADARVRGYVIGGALYQTDGSQYTLEGLRQMAAELGISDRVGFTGFVEEPAAAMRSLDVVVHASTEPEPFGLVIAEAMACGRAVIASLAGGAAEIIDVGVNALGHRPGDAASLASCIKRLASDADLRATLGRAGRASAEKNFDRARLAADLAPIYDELVSGYAHIAST